MDMVMKNKHLPWIFDFYANSRNKNITINDILKHPTHHFKWDWYQLSKNKNITFNMILYNPNPYFDYDDDGNETYIDTLFHWDWNGVSQNPNVTIKNVIENPHELWNWALLTNNEGITVENILNNSTLPWYWNNVTYSPNITIDFCLDCLNEKIKQIPPSYLNWSVISHRHNITMDIVLKHRNLPWYWNYFGLNKNVTIDFVLGNIDKPWDWYLLCQNQFDNDRENFVVVKIKWLLLAMVYDTYQTKFIHVATPFSRIEYILLDSYLIKQLVKF